MGLVNLKAALKDRMTIFYAVAYSALAVFAYLLIVRHDLRIFYNSNSSLQEIEHNLRTLKTIAQYKGFIGEFKTRFTITKGANQLVEMITDAANKESVNLKLVRPVDSRMIAGYKNISVSVEGSAPYHSMARFIARLENNTKYIIIEDFSFVSEKGSGANAAEGAVRVARPPVPIFQKPVAGKALMPPTPDLLMISGAESAPLGPRTANFKLTATCFSAET